MYGFCNLAQEIFIEVLSYLNQKEIITVELVCHNLHSRIEEKQTWTDIISTKFKIPQLKILEILLEDYKSWKELLLYLSNADLSSTFYTGKEETIGQVKGSEPFGCSHYARNNKIMANCCKKWVKKYRDDTITCRVCHNREDCDKEIDRYATKIIMCMFCKTIQGVSNQCINCLKKFSDYFCNICNLWDDQKGKEIYHCPYCKICRLRRGEENYHCTICGACGSICRESHTCVRKLVSPDREICPLCNTETFSSSKRLVFVNCPKRHVFHQTCHQIENLNPKTLDCVCPICPAVSDSII